MEDYNYTPAALASRLNEASVIFSKFVLLSSSYGEDAMYCFVEGYDMPYYRAIIRGVCRKEPIEIKCNGKGNVITANIYIESMKDYKHYQKRYFVDHDFDNNDDVPNTIFVTDGYSIENYYLSDKCVSSILETEFKISKITHKDNHKKCMDLFHQEHNKFFEGTLLFNAWYSCLYNNPDWNRKGVSLDDSFPKGWLNLNIGNITFNYTLADIEAKYDKAPKLDKELILKRKEELRILGAHMSRGKYEIQFLFKFLSMIKEESPNSRVYSVAKCSIPFNQNTIISTFSQYAEVSDKLFNYLEKGIR